MELTKSPLEIRMLLYPGLTLLDLIGPATVFSWHANIRLVWKTKDLVVSDSGIGIQPTSTFEACPSDRDILFVPGGLGRALWTMAKSLRSLRIELRDPST